MTFVMHDSPRLIRPDLHNNTRSSLIEPPQGTPPV